MFKVEDLVVVTGLKKDKDLNGAMGIVVGHAPDKVDKSITRHKVMLAKGDTTISAKASNLTSLDFDETAQKHEVGIFWPKASSSQRESIVCPIKDWPSDYNRETQFLRKNLKWTDPQILGGVEGPGDAKPNYMMYYDANDVKSFPNQFANAIAARLPGYEHDKVPSPGGSGDYRGACIIVYSPMNTSSDYGKGKAKSMNDFKQVIDWHGTKAAERQYDGHDNIMHRMYGGVPGAGAY